MVFDDSVTKADIYQSGASNNICKGVSLISAVTPPFLGSVLHWEISPHSDSNGDVLAFWFWDGTNSKLIKLIPTYSFIINDTKTVLTRLNLTGSFSLKSSIPVKREKKIINDSNINIIKKRAPRSGIAYNGWNWISFNKLKSGAQSVDTYFNNIFTGLTSSSYFTTDLTLKTVDDSGVETFTIYYKDFNSWYGGLTTVTPKQFYQLKWTGANKSNAFDFTGTSILPSSYSRNIYRGWNWLGFTPSSTSNDIAVSFATLFSGMVPSDFTGDLTLKTVDDSGVETFTIYYKDYNSWFGGLTTLNPNQGYQLKWTSNNKTFHFPDPPVTSITATQDNLKVVFDGTDKYEVFLVPDANGEIKNNKNVGSSTVFACTAFTYSGDYNTSLQNIDTSAANTEALLSGTGTTLLTNNHVCNGTNVSTVLLADVQTGFDKLHRVTWYKAGETFTASTDYKIMQLKHTGTDKLIGSLELYYGDASNGDQKKYVVSFTNDATTVSIAATDIANPPPFRKYYVEVIPGQLPAQDPYYTFYNDASKSPGSAVDLIGATQVTANGIYKRATYVFERISTGGHPFQVRSSGNVTIGLFKQQGNALSNAGDKLLMFTTENYNGGVEYYCTAHSSMVKAFNLKNQASTAGYDALVDSDRHIEAGQNIRLEVEGEEIKL